MSLSHPTKAEQRAELIRRIVDLATKDPEIQRTVIARRFGCSDAFVTKVLKNAGIHTKRVNGSIELP